MVGFPKEQATENQTQVACEEMREFLMQTAKWILYKIKIPSWIWKWIMNQSVEAFENSQECYKGMA